jgi:hypothetical protein
MLSPLFIDLAAVLMGAGLLLSVIYERAGSIGLGAGSVAVGLALLSTVPEGWELVGYGFFGISLIVGLWMIRIGLKRSKSAD